MTRDRSLSEVPTISFFERNHMLWLIAGVLLVLWLIGMVGVYAMGAFVHLFLVLAIVVVILNFVRGTRRV